MDDSILIRQWREGSSEAFGMLYSKYNDDLVRYINYLDPTCPEDTAHDVWLKVRQKLDKYHDGNFGGWLFKVAHGTVIDRIRKRPKPITWLPEYESGPDIMDDIDLMVLNARQRAVVLLRMQGLEFKDISKITGIPLGTITPAYTTAIIKIRKDLMKRGIINKVPHMDMNSRYMYKPHKSTNS